MFAAPSIEMIRPDYKEFSRLAREATLVPVVKSVMADLLTPVSAFLAISRGEKQAFLLESIERGEQIGRYTFLGARPYMQLRTRAEEAVIEKGKKREVRQGSVFQIAKELLQQHRPAVVSGMPPFTAGAVGFCSYDIARQLENIGDETEDDLHLPDCVLMFFDRLLAFDHLHHQIHIIAAADVSAESPRNAYDRAVTDIGVIEKKLAAGLRPVQWQTQRHKAYSKLKVQPVTARKKFEESVTKAKEYIAAGDIFQVVLSQRLDFTPEAPPFDIYRALRAVNPSPYMYFLKMGDTHVLGSSPEMLVRVTGRKLEYRPIAGTHPRGRDEAEDQRLQENMLSDEKERAEHVMLVDLALEGKLRAELHALDAFAACFPAGTLSGAPKVRAMQIIEELEPTRRAIYGGSVLYADFAGNLDSCIAIRTMLMQGTKAYLQAGAGIVADSDPASEYQESLNKAKAVLRAVETARGAG